LCLVSLCYVVHYVVVFGCLPLHLELLAMTLPVIYLASSGLLVICLLNILLCLLRKIEKINLYLYI